MKKTLFLLILITVSFSQGKLYDSKIADTDFGKVVQEIVVDKSTLLGSVMEIKKTFSKESYGKIAFSFNDFKSTYILQNAEQLEFTKTNKQLYVFSYTMILALLKESSKTPDVLRFQIRDKTYIETLEGSSDAQIFTIQYGDTVLQRADPCPPICG